MKRTTIIVLAVVAAAVVGLWYFLAFAPAGDDLSETRDELETAQREEQDLQATLSRLEALEDERPSLEATLNDLEAAIPENPDLAEFILQADQAAQSSGIDWLSVAPSEPAPNATGGPAEIALAIQVEGGFYQVLDYLDQLEELERLVVVDSVNIAAAGEGSSSGAPDLSVTLAARMFTRTLAAAPSTDGTTAPVTPTTPSTPSGDSETTS